MSPAKRTFLPDPAGLWGLTLFIVLTSIGGAKALKDGDTLWHIRMGQEMIARGELLTTDLFSHTVYGQPWHSHEWLWEVMMAGLHDLAGLAGVAIFSFAIVALTFTIIFKVAARHAGDISTSLATAMALPYVYIHLLARPHLFTWLGAALTIFLLEKGGRWPWLLVPVTTVWANLHGGVLFGLVIQVIFITGNCLDRYQPRFSAWLSNCQKKEKSALLILFACIAATLINPFGYQIFLFPFKVAAPVFTQGISEWRAPDFQELWFAKPWVIGILLMAIWSGRKFPWRWNLLTIFLLWQTLGHVRNLSIAALMLIPCFAMFFHELADRFKFHHKKRNTEEDLALSSWTGPACVTLLTFIFTVVFTTDLPGVKVFAKNSFPPGKDNLEEVIAFLKQGYPDKNLLNDYEWGDYLIYALEDPPKVFIDGRADMYGEKVFSDHSRILSLDKKTDELIEEYNIGWTLLEKDSALNTRLKDCNGWSTIYTDDSIEILTKGR